MPGCRASFKHRLLESSTSRRLVGHRTAISLFQDVALATWTTSQEIPTSPAACRTL